MKKKIFKVCMGVAAILACWSIVTGNATPAFLGFVIFGAGLWVDRMM